MEFSHFLKRQLKEDPGYPDDRFLSLGEIKKKGGRGFENNTMTRILLVSVRLLLGSTTHNSCKGGDFSAKQWKMVGNSLVWWETPVIVALRK